MSASEAAGKAASKAASKAAGKTGREGAATPPGPRGEKEEGDEESRITFSSLLADFATTTSRPLPRLLARVRLACALRAAWLRHLWSLEGPRGDGAIGHGEVDAALADRDNPVSEAAWIAGQSSLAALARELEALEVDPPVAELVTLFGLEAEESDLLELALAREIDPTLGRVYAYLQDHAGRPYATEELAARLFRHGLAAGPGASAGIVLGPESPLRRWGLIEEREVAPAEPRALLPDPQIRDLLLGRRGLAGALLGAARLVSPQPPLASWPAAETASFIRDLLGAGHRVRVTVVGPPGAGRKSFAATVAAALDLPLLALDTDAFGAEALAREEGSEALWQRFYLAAQRQAFLDRTALAWSGPGALERRWSPAVLPFPLQFVMAEGRERPLLAPPASEREPGEEQGFVEHRVELPPLSVDERRDLWRRYLPAAAAWQPAEVDELARRFRATVGEIVAVGARGVTSAATAATALRTSSRHRLGELAERVECPFTRDDLIVPEHVATGLDDFLYEASERTVLWEERAVARLFPEGRGLLGLFSGPSGTGKTMAAQVIAAELGLDLYRIDLAAVISKYIGETSKNLERVLTRARHMDAVLLFDEADTLFGRRTEVKDAHDRFANADTNYLLQAIEAYPGVALLSTNRKGNVDPAFLRRLRYMLEFPKPDAPSREAIWRRLVGELAGPERLGEKDENGCRIDENLTALAQTLDLTGAQIKHAILAGLITARRQGAPLSLSHLLRGVDRELAKEGRAVSERERKRLAGRGGGA